MVADEQRLTRRQWTLVSVLSISTALNTLIGRANIAVPSTFDQVRHWWLRGMNGDVVKLLGQFSLDCSMKSRSLRHLWMRGKYDCVETLREGT